MKFVQLLSLIAILAFTSAVFSASYDDEDEKGVCKNADGTECEEVRVIGQRPSDDDQP